MDEIGKDAIFYEQSGGGVTFSGGEPLAQAAFLMAVLRMCKCEGYHTTVETTGFTDVKTLLKAGELTDLFLYDVKLMNSQVHRKFTGVSNASMLANLRALSRHHGNVVVRVPVIPGVTDTAQNLRELGEFLSGLDGVSEVHLLPYHRHGMDKYSRLGRPFLMGAVLPPDAGTMRRIAEQLTLFGKRVSIGGSPDR
jgi:pyruvate formate lyase activating enzyme